MRSTPCLGWGRAVPSGMSGLCSARLSPVGCSTLMLGQGYWIHSELESRYGGQNGVQDVAPGESPAWMRQEEFPMPHAQGLVPVERVWMDCVSRTNGDG